MSSARHTGYDQAGTIRSVEMIDFMCHEHLKIDFPQQITFITGPNGSGKSAILTALQVFFNWGEMKIRWHSAFVPIVQEELTDMTN